MDTAFRDDELFVGCQGDGSVHVIDIPGKRHKTSFSAGTGCESLGFFLGALVTKLANSHRLSNTNLACTGRHAAASGGRAGQHPCVPAQVVFHKRGNKEIGMVVSLMPPQRQWDAGLGTSSFQ